MKSAASLFALLLFASNSGALDTGYLSFDLSESQWTCKKSEIRFVCQPSDPKSKTQALVVVNAKLAGPEDSMKQYHNFLQQPKMLNVKGQLPQPSKVMYSNLKMIGPQQWVESLHESSEVPNFYTLYLATRSGEVSILLQLSAAISQEKKFRSTFKKLIESVRISPAAIAQISAAAARQASKPAYENQLSHQDNVANDSLGRLATPKFLMLLGGLVLLLGLGLFVYYKKS